MAEDYKRNRQVIRGAMKVTPKEKDARRIEIECIEVPGDKAGGEDYIVTVFPKDKQNEPGRKHESSIGMYTEPIRRVFKSEEETLKYLKEVL